MTVVNGGTTNVYGSTQPGALSDYTNAAVGVIANEGVLGSGRGYQGNLPYIDAEGRSFNRPFPWIRLTTVGGGSTAIHSSIASTLSGATLLFGGGSSGQVFQMPDPREGQYFRLLGIADATSAATIFQWSSNVKVQVANAATPSSGNALQSTNADIELGQSFEVFGINSTLVIVVNGRNGVSTMSAIATT